MQDILVSRLHDLSLLNQHLLILCGEEDLSRVESQITIASMVNCTTHPITIVGMVNCTTHPTTLVEMGELPPSGILPKVKFGFADFIPFNWLKERYKVGGGVVIGLPDPVKGLSFIVSEDVRNALSLTDPLSRPDVYRSF